MSDHPAAYLAYTAPINPPNASPVVTKDQVWAALHRKTRYAQEFVPNAIKATEVVSETKDEHGRDVVTRDVIFVEGDRKAREVCTYFPQMKVEVSTQRDHGGLTVYAFSLIFESKTDFIYSF